MEESNTLGLMPPPWLAYPQIERYSIGWRMGAGEEYINRFGEWWVTLSAERKEKYQTLFPEPVTWQGWWRSEDTCTRFQYGEYAIELWQPQGMPKYSNEWLRQQTAEGKARELCMFWMPEPVNGVDKSCFSQWWLGEFWSVIDTFCCVEQFMTVQMAKLFGDAEAQKAVMECDDPKWMKPIGHRVKDFDQGIWDMVKYSVVVNGNWYKFSQNRELRDFLLSSGDSVLVYASPYDETWGIMLSEEDEEAQDPANWQGQNLLGYALMEVRDELRRVTQNEALCDFGQVEM